MKDTPPTLTVYRTEAPAPDKVYCGTCRHFSPSVSGRVDLDTCKRSVPSHRGDDTGHLYQYCSDVNSDFGCTSFKAKDIPEVALAALPTQSVSRLRGNTANVGVGLVCGVLLAQIAHGLWCWP